MDKLFLLAMGMIFFAPDSGGTDGGGSVNTTPPADPPPTEPTEPPGSTQDPPPAEPPADPPADNSRPHRDVLDMKDKADEPPIPKYSSQLKAELRDSEDYKKYVYKNKDLSELSDSYVSLSKRLENAIEIPGEDASKEEIQAFLKNLGVPEGADKYVLPNVMKDESEIYKDLESAMRIEFHKSGLSMRQAANMWKLLSHGLASSKVYSENHEKMLAQSFDSRLSKQLGDDFPSEADKSAAMKEIGTIFNQHIERTGLGKYYKDSGLIFNPEFVKKVVDDEKKRGAKSTIVGEPGGKGTIESTGTFGDDYSKDFNERYK